MTTSRSRVKRGLAVLSALVAVLGGVGLSGPAAAADPASVHGTVTAPDGSPVAGIEVCAERRTTSGGAWDRYRCRTTAADGSYAIPLRSGTFRFTAEQTYLYGDWVAQSYRDGAAYSFGATTSRTVSFQMIPGARISGFLSTPDGSVPGDNYLWVEAYRVGSSGTVAKRPAQLSNVNGQGYFQVAKLPAGTYKLLVTDHDEPFRFAQQWYPDAVSASAADAVSVETGVVSTDHDMTLTSPVSLAISLRGPGDKRARGMVEVHDVDGRVVALAGDQYPTSVTVDGLHPGAYKVRAHAYSITGYSEWYSHKRSAATANVITVGAQPTTSRTLTFHPRKLKVLARPKAKLAQDTVTFTAPRWSKRPTVVRYYVVREGRRTVQVVGRRYFTVKKDVGHRLKVCAVAERRGYQDATSCSRPTPKVKVAW